MVAGRALVLVGCALAGSAQKPLLLQQQQVQEGQQRFTLAGMEFSGDDLKNQEKINDWASRAFHPQAWDTVAGDLARLAQASAEFPALSLGVGMALYSYFWWEGDQSTRVNVTAGREAASMLHRSILYNGCDSAALSLQNFFLRQCHVRWRYLLMIAVEVGRHTAVSLRDNAQAATLMREASEYFQQARWLPFFTRYGGFGTPLRKPHDTNFNQDYFPHVAYGPIWPKAVLPLSEFLEAHSEEFLADLSGVLDDETFWDLHAQNRSAETQLGPRDDDWQTVYLVRDRRWSEQNCRRAPRSCQLLRSRPELAAECELPGAGAGLLRLRPGARLKPRLGNAPRLSVHLGLIVPESGDVHMSVGGQDVRWEVGKAIVFDDTFIHSVAHDGSEPRFVLNIWLCHPCDSAYLPGGLDDLPSYCIP